MISWPTKKLGEVAEIIMGQSPSSSTYNESGDGLPFYQGKKDYGDINPTVRIWCSVPGKVVEAGDILISVRAPVGALNIASERSCIGRGLSGIRGGKYLDQDFLYHFLRGKEKEIASWGTGSTFASISKKHLEKIEIPVPPIDEQRKIVARIEKQFAKIDEVARLRAESHAATAALLPAALHEIFSQTKSKGWEEKSLGNITEIVTGKTPPTSKRQYYDGEILWAGPSDFGELKFMSRTRKTITNAAIKDGVVRIVQKGTVLVSCIGTIGKVAIAQESMATNQQINAFVPNVRIVFSDFLYYAIIAGRSEFEKRSSKTTLPIINKSRCAEIKIPLPPLVEQKEIVKKLDALSEKVRTLQALQSQQATDLKALKQSLLHEAFSRNL